MDTCFLDKELHESEVKLLLGTPFVKLQATCVNLHSPNTPFNAFITRVDSYFTSLGDKQTRKQEQEI